MPGIRFPQRGPNHLLQRFGEPFQEPHAESLGPSPGSSCAFQTHPGSCPRGASTCNMLHSFLQRTVTSLSSGQKAKLHRKETVTCILWEGEGRCRGEDGSLLSIRWPSQVIVTESKGSFGPSSPAAGSERAGVVLRKRRRTRGSVLNWVSRDARSGRIWG